MLVAIDTSICARFLFTGRVIYRSRFVFFKKKIE